MNLQQPTDKAIVNITSPSIDDVGWYYDDDKHVPAVERQSVIMMGFNPGAGIGATETKLSASEKAWRTRSNGLASGLTPRLVYAELIAESSRDIRTLRSTNRSLVDALALAASSCRRVIAYHKPDLILQAGLDTTAMADVKRLYDLEFVTEKARPANSRHVLFRHYLTPTGVNWISFRHFAAPGFSQNDRDAIRGYATQLRHGKRSIEEGGHE